MDRFSPAIRHLLFAIVLALAGCARVPLGNAPFTVATSWSEAERSDLERAFAVWLKADGRGAEPVRIDWVPFSPGDDLTRLVPSSRKRLDWRSRPLDVVLGEPATGYVRLERLGRLVAVDRPGRPLWCVAREGSITNAEGPSVRHDPRHDPDALAWAKHALEGSRQNDGATWESGYAALVRGAFADDATVFRGTEGVAIVNGGDNPSVAQRFLKFLAERGQAKLSPDDPGDPEADALLADLLGATLVDASDELGVARKAVERQSGRASAVSGIPHPGPPPRRGREELAPSPFGGEGRGGEKLPPAHWMTQPPPWPPASVTKLMTQDKSGGLLETLAAQMAPDADVRAWLVRSWLGPPRLIDGQFLAELSRAAGGKLVREPRFRAWLRGEWTAWARQRYRRVARLAALGATRLPIGVRR